MEDPDEQVSIPFRELAAAQKLVSMLAAAMDSEAGLAEKLASSLAGLDTEDLASLPEIGPISGQEQLRLHLHRLNARLDDFLPSTPQPLPPPPATLPSVGPSGLKTRRPSRSGAIVGGENEDIAHGFVWWDDISEEETEEFHNVLDSAKDERPLQRYLALHPRLLVQHMSGGHGRWVLSQKRLGSEYVPDFLIAERSSSGFEWQFVELQSPLAGLFVPSSGRLTEQFDEGLRQIRDWRRWLSGGRLDYARQNKSKGGLGLPDISPQAPGLLLIGRETALSESDIEQRRQLDEQQNVRIHTYDWLGRSARRRIDAVRRMNRDDPET